MLNRNNHLLTLKLNLQWAVAKPRPLVGTLKPAALKRLAANTLSLATKELEQSAALSTFKGSKLTLEVPIRITSQEEIKALNRNFRRVDEPTNVLSFPCDESAWLKSKTTRELGDLVICADVVSLEATLGAIKLEDHWAHILVHGLLHLLGLDHITPKPRRYMQHLEGRILSASGYANPHPEV